MKTAKRFLCILMALMLPCISAFAATTPKGYPEVKQGIDMGGKTLYIYDYWSSGGDWRNWEPATEEDKAQYDYMSWLENTYNVHFQQTARGDWGTCAEEMTEFTAKGGEDSLAMFIIEPGKVGSLVSNGVTAAWNYDLSAEKWNKATTELLTKDDEVYGTSVGSAEPRQMVFFNKRVLSEAGIDWNDLYDMQKKGTWTWAAFEKLLKKVQRDTDNDGEIDIYGMTGNRDNMEVISVFTNGGSFFEFTDSGNLVPVLNSSATIEGLQWATDTWSKYSRPTPEGADWNWYIEGWKEGNTAFYVNDAYTGFNDNSEMADMEDEWGAVAFPVPEKGDNYLTVIAENVTLIPSCYDEDTVAKLAFLYDMWTNETPGYESDDSWIGNKYNYTDERAVDETYAMLLDPKHAVSNKSNLLGNINDILGGSLLWALGDEYTVAELVEAGMAEWKEKCDIFNQDSNGKDYGWIRMGSHKYYMQKNGSFTAGKTLKLNGKKYTFNDKGQLTKINGKAYTGEEKPVTGIKLDAAKKTLKVKDSFTLKATVNPADADNRMLKWSSSDKKVAKVTDSGKVTAVGEGSCTVTATAADGSGVKASCEIKVEKAKAAKSITLKTTSQNVKMSKTKSLTLKATVKPKGAAVAWKTSNKKVATVDESGNVTIIGKGSCTITAYSPSDKKIAATCELTVK